jgi:hypothetical protein
LYISSGSTLYINGGMLDTLNGTKRPDVVNNGTINITGDLHNAANTLYSGTGLFQMSGTGVQNFSGANYYDLSVTGAGEKRMNGATHLKDSLVFTDGSINTALTQDTIYMDSAAVINELPGSEVIGYMRYQKYLAKGASYTFGNLGLTLNAAGAAPGMTSVVRVTGDSAIQHYGIATSIKRYFDIVPTNNTGLNAGMTFYYEDAELNGIAENDLEMFKSKDTGSNWIVEGYASRNSTLNYLTLTGLNDFSRWTAGSQTTPLPVELLSFTAKLLSQQSSLLEWQTASELNNDHFDIERSEDGLSFIKIGEQKGAGTTQIRQEYAFTDNFGIITSNILYYRLKQVDYNGKFTYSEIRKLQLSEKTNSFNAWYNANEDKTIALLTYTKPTLLSLKLIDIQGKLIGEQSISLPTGESRIQLDMFGLAKGIYTLSVADETGVKVKRIMKY